MAARWELRAAILWQIYGRVAEWSKASFLKSEGDEICVPEFESLFYRQHGEMAESGLRRSFRKRKVLRHPKVQILFSPPIRQATSWLIIEAYCPRRSHRDGLWLKREVSADQTLERIDLGAVPHHGN